MDMRTHKVVAGTRDAKNVADDGGTDRGGARNGGEGGWFNVAKQTRNQTAEIKSPEGPLS